MARKKRSAKKPLKRFTAKQRAAILAEAKAKGFTAEDVAAKYGIVRGTYYLWRKQAGVRGWYGVGRRVAWAPQRREHNEQRTSALKRMTQKIVAEVVRGEVARCLRDLDCRSPSTREKQS